MPKDTNEMKYSRKHHMYLLDLDHLKNEFGLDFIAKERSEVKAKDTMYKISRTIYHFIYAHSHYKKHLEFLLAKDESVRDTIQLALEEQARYEYEMSVEYLSLQSGINVLNGVVIPIDKIRGMIRIAPAAELILRNKNILYQGQRIVTKTDFDYDKEDY